MAQSGHSTMTRPIDEMVTEIHDRATAIRRRRSRKRALASVSGLAMVAAIALVLVLPAPPAAPPSAHKAGAPSLRAEQLARYGQLIQETAQASGGTTPQPPNQPVGLGWSAPKPSLPKAVHSEWSPLVISALEVFEHVTQTDQPPTLTVVQAQSSSQVDMPQGTVAIDTLAGLVSGGQAGDWTMTATSQQPFSAGGSVMFRGSCSWAIPDNSQGANGSAGAQSGTCTNLLVTLVGDPANPYSAAIARWTGAAMRAPLTRTP
jgi:hypothetical protein